MSDGRFALIHATADAMIPKGLTAAWRAGLLGEIAIRSDAQTMLSDITGLGVPGLAAMGVAASILRIPDEVDEAMRAILSAVTRRRTAVALSIHFVPSDEPPADPENPRTQDGRVVREAAIVSASKRPDCVTMHGDPAITVGPGEFLTAYSHIISFAPSKHRWRRRGNSAAALLRWCAFASAYPDRALSAEPEDDTIRQRACIFLTESAGRRDDRTANRMRRAAMKCADLDMTTAMELIAEAALLELGVQAAARIALLTPTDERLPDPARRELIYLARAGTRELKVMSARRLMAESEASDAMSTIEQLAFDSDPWVRAAATG